MSVADEIKGKLDIVDYVQRYVPLKRAGKSYKACCPFHNEKTPSFVVNPDTQSWRCFGQCGVGGDVISFAMRQNGWSFTEALQELGKMTGVEVRKQTPEQKAQYERLDGLRGLLQAAADAYHERLLDSSDASAVATLKYTQEKRGLTLDTIRQFKIGYALPGWNQMLDYLKQLGYTEGQIIETGMAIRNDSGQVYDRFRNRLLIPIRDERGRAIGFGARILDPNDTPKYLNSPQTALFDKSHTLFGLDTAKTAIRETETAVIVEGYMDAIQAHQAGFRNVVAQMGTALTETQLRLLTRSAKKIILALDSDAAGQSATTRSVETARATLKAAFGGQFSVDIRILQVPGAKDPDDLIRETPEQWAELVANAVPVADYMIDLETAKLPPDASLQDREDAARRLVLLMYASENTYKLYDAENLQKLSSKLRLPNRNMEALLSWASEEKLKKLKEEKPLSSSDGVTARDKTAWDDSPDLPNKIGKEGEPVHILPAMQSIVAKRSPALREAAVEEQCLRLLFQQPEAYYAVNRRLREIIENNLDKPLVVENRQTLLDGPLTDWSGDDFSHSDARVLMQLFMDGLKHYEMNALDYVRENAGESLQEQIEALLADDLVGMRSRLRNGHSGDSALLWHNNRRYVEGSEPHAELIEKALRLRLGRLQRERDELSFLQIDSRRNGDSEAEQQFQRHIWLSNLGRGLIDAELQKITKTLRE